MIKKMLLSMLSCFMIMGSSMNIVYAQDEQDDSESTYDVYEQIEEERYQEWLSEHPEGLSIGSVGQFVHWSGSQGSRYFYDGYDNQMGTSTAVKVIDISSWQGDIDWDAVKNSGEVDAVIIRCGYGSAHEDKKFARNIEAVKRLGIPYGIYLFSYSEDAEEATDEAEFVYSLIQKYDLNLSFPIYYDLESWELSDRTYHSPTSTTTYEEIVDAFVSYMAERSYTANIYSYRNYLTGVLNSPNILKYVSWVAVFDNPSIGFENPYYTGVQGWQYTSSATVEGISGSVDMSAFYNLEGTSSTDNSSTSNTTSNSSTAKNNSSSSSSSSTSTSTVTETKKQISGNWLVSNNRWWYRHSDGSYTTSDFETINGQVYYFDSEGYMVTGWQKVNGTWYYFTSSGARYSGWAYLWNTWYYMDADGKMLTGFYNVNGQTYFSDASGAMITGWFYVNGAYYYAYGSGAIARNCWIDGYYVDGNGKWISSMPRGQWKLNSVGWWYRHGDGSYAVNDFEVINSKTYYFDADGYMVTGWRYINNNWYFFESSGAMVTGWYKVNGTWYYSYSDGKMAANTTIGGYTLNASGAWVR